VEEALSVQKLQNYIDMTVAGLGCLLAIFCLIRPAMESLTHSSNEGKNLFEFRFPLMLVFLGVMLIVATICASLFNVQALSLWVLPSIPVLVVFYFLKIIPTINSYHGEEVVKVKVNVKKDILESELFVPFLLVSYGLLYLTTAAYFPEYEMQVVFWLLVIGTPILVGYSLWFIYKTVKGFMTGQSKNYGSIAVSIVLLIGLVSLALDFLEYGY